MKKITNLILAIAAVLVLTNITACKKPTSYDYPAANGSAYDIIKDDLNFTYFRTIVDRAGLADMIADGDYTVFVPNNNAFLTSGYTLAGLQATPPADLAILVKNHIIAGKVDVKTGDRQQTSLSNTKITLQTIGNLVYVDGSDITSPNEATTKGYVNIISKVLVTKPTLLDAINGYTNATANSQLTYLAAAIARASTGSTNFTNLLTATNASYTLFAPTNGAFIDAGYATIAAINTTNAETLGNILKYHLVQGAKFTTAFDSVPVPAYSGTNIYFDVTKVNRNTTYSANGIVFGSVGANVVANNGVLHVVPRILPTPIPGTVLDKIKTDAPMFAALIARASTADPLVNYETMLSGTTPYTVFAVNDAGLKAAGYANVAAINAELPATLATILRHHILPKRINSINIPDNGTVNSLLRIPNSSGTTSPAALLFNVGNPFKIKGASNAASVTVISQNITTTNGIVNIIGTVLTP